MIYDCFPFNNELDLLEIRLNHHDPFVDKFVISECRWTYSGLPKRLCYDEVKDQEPFARFKDKIIHIVYEIPPNGKANWAYEHDQRNNLRQLVSTLKKNDLIVYCDCDEIIRGKAVIDEALSLDCIVSLDMKLCWYYFNCVIRPGSEYQLDYSMEQCFEHRWHMGKICRAKHLFQFKNLYELRQHCLWEPDRIHTIFNAGWHFSNLGDPGSIYDKLMAFSQRARKRALMDPLGRGVYFIPTYLDVPQYILDNRDKYSEYILDVPNNQKS